MLHHRFDFFITSSDCHPTFRLPVRSTTSGPCIVHLVVFPEDVFRAFRFLVHWVNPFLSNHYQSFLSAFPGLQLCLRSLLDMWSKLTTTFLNASGSKVPPPPLANRQRTAAGRPKPPVANMSFEGIDIPFPSCNRTFPSCNRKVALGLLAVHTVQRNVPGPLVSLDVSGSARSLNVFNSSAFLAVCSFWFLLPLAQDQRNTTRLRFL